MIITTDKKLIKSLLNLIMETLFKGCLYTIVFNLIILFNFFFGDINVKLQQVTDNNYIKRNKIYSRLNDDLDFLENSINLSFNSDNFFLNICEEDNYIIQEENTEFGFNLDNFKVDRDTIQFGDSFGEIMLRNKLSYSQIYNIVESIKDSFDVRWLTAGKPYTILSTKDSLLNPQYFIYQPNLLNYVVIDFSNFDSITAYNKKKPFKIVFSKK